MNYGELKQAILDDTHRQDLSSHVERFVRQCEGLIRRDLTAYTLRTTITDADRVTAGEGIYNFPARLLQVRTIHLQGRQGDSLQRVSPSIIRRLDASAAVIQYAQYGSGDNARLEFRGIPSTADIFDILYYGTPAPFSADTDENDLLTDHETLYIAGGKYYLYLHEQNRELASDEAQIFDATINKLNEKMAREIGGSNIAPMYNFSSRSAY